jgi:hypothetical protein
LRKTLGMLMVLGLVVLVAGVAGANTIVVPFFNDGGSLASEAASGMRTYIRVKNLDAATITVAIAYTDFYGVDATPSPNTFLLGPKASIGFRPVANDATSEGDGTRVPDAVTTGTSFGVFGGGGCEISSTNSILGMVAQEDYFVGSAGGSGIAPAVSAP